MLGSSKDFKSEKLIVKINNTKLKNSGDSSPMSRKNRHSSIDTNDDSSDEQELSKYEYDHYKDQTSPRPSRHSKLDKFGRSRDLDRLRHTYKVLCVNTIHPKASDQQVKDILYQEYRKFGEFSVKISYEKNKRLAYVRFRRSKDAKNAKHSKRMIKIFDSVSLVTPVYKSRSSRDRYKSKARHFQSQNFSTDFERDCPTSTEIHGSLPTDRFYEMLPYGALPPMRPLKVFREMSLPPLRPQELMIPHHPLMHHLAPIHHQLRPIQPFFRLPTHIFPPYTPHPHSCVTHDKKDKFPNYLHHIKPEDDPLATRTLFAGNLEITITDEELQSIFGKYGVVEDIDVKRPLLGTGNSYAFVRYQNLDMAHKAKVELSGKYIGKYECKIGYGKPIPTQRIWIGGLSPRTTLAQLEQEFDRFGVIKNIEYNNGDICAHILFKSIDAAIAAVKGMRGVALRGSRHRLRTDFANRRACNSPTLTSSSYSKSSQDNFAEDLQELLKQDDSAKDSLKLTKHYDIFESFRELTKQDNSVKDLEKLIKQDNSDENSQGLTKEDDLTVDAQQLTKQNEYPFDGPDDDKKSHPKDQHVNSHESFKQHSVSDSSSPQSSLQHSIDSDEKSEEKPIPSVYPLDPILTLENFVLKCTDVWHGIIEIRNIQFSTSCYLTFGDINVLKTVMKTEDCEPILHITKQLPLNESVLKEISKPEKITNMRAMFLAIPYTNNSISNNKKIRPFHNLVLLLKQKMFFGISITSKDVVGSALCVFPPCEYSTKLLKQNAKNLDSETLKYEDYLVVIVTSIAFLK